MVAIETHVFEVIMFPSGPKAALGIGHAGVRTRTWTQETRDKGIHPGIDEKQVFTMFRRQKSSGGNDFVPPGGEKLKKTAADIGRLHGRPIMLNLQSFFNIESSVIFCDATVHFAELFYRL
jgi:hypothetical protein